MEICHQPTSSVAEVSQVHRSAASPVLAHQMCRLPPSIVLEVPPAHFRCAGHATSQLLACQRCCRPISGASKVNSLGRCCTGRATVAQCTGTCHICTVHRKWAGGTSGVPELGRCHFGVPKLDQQHSSGLCGTFSALQVGQWQLSLRQ